MLPPHLAGAYVINPQMVANFDEQLAEKIVSGMDSQPDADDYLVACGGSGVRLLVFLYAECNKLGGTASRLVVDEVNAMTARTWALGLHHLRLLEVPKIRFTDSQSPQ